MAGIHHKHYSINCDRDGFVTAETKNLWLCKHCSFYFSTSDWGTGARVNAEATAFMYKHLWDCHIKIMKSEATKINDCAA